MNSNSRDKYFREMIRIHIETIFHIANNEIFQMIVTQINKPAHTFII